MTLYFPGKMGRAEGEKFLITVIAKPLQPVDVTAVLHSGCAFLLQFKQAEDTAQTQATMQVTS